MGIVFVLIVGCVTALYFFLRNQMSYFKRRGIPCDEPSWLAGNLDAVGTKVHFVSNIQTIYEKFKIGNKLCGFFLLQSPRLIIIDLDLIKTVLIKDFSNFTDRAVYNNAEVDPLSAHLFAIEGK